jgi:mannose-6-phosphate isomerase-like protein (cupin superfamily)
MSAYTICAFTDAPDVLGDYPGEMRMLGGPLAAEQVSCSFRRMPQHTGGKGSYGHRHRTQEEVYVVLSGRLEFKLGDDVVELGPGTAVRIAPSTVRSVWNARPEDAELLIFSVRLADSTDEVELVPDFWPA